MRQGEAGRCQRWNKGCCSGRRDREDLRAILLHTCGPGYTVRQFGQEGFPRCLSGARLTMGRPLDQKSVVTLLGSGGSIAKPTWMGCIGEPFLPLPRSPPRQVRSTGVSRPSADMEHPRDGICSASSTYGWVAILAAWALHRILPL